MSNGLTTTEEQLLMKQAELDRKLQIKQSKRLGKHAKAELIKAKADKLQAITQESKSVWLTSQP